MKSKSDVVSKETIKAPVENDSKIESLPISSDDMVFPDPLSSSAMSDGVQSWRNILEDLDNIYTKSNVSEIRDTFIKKYLDKSEHANQQQDWTRRNMYRVSAISQLKKAASHLEELYKTTTDHALKEECMLAIAELSHKAEDYDKAITWGKKVISETSDKKLQAHAYDYIVKSFARSGDVTNAQKFRELFFRNLHDETRKFYGGGDIAKEETYELEALMRILAFHYEMAEGLGDMAVQFPELAAGLRERRDNQIAIAQDAFNSAIVPLLGALEY